MKSNIKQGPPNQMVQFGRPYSETWVPAQCKQRSQLNLSKAYLHNLLHKSEHKFILKHKNGQISPTQAFSYIFIMLMYFPSLWLFL